MQVKKTTNYKKFKLKKGNRKVINEHVMRLVKSIKEKNMLEVNPIIINSNEEIIDGQHRLAAAELMKIPIYYVEFNPASIREIQMLNANQKGWQALDYANSYVALGNKEYEVYIDFREKYKLPHGTILSLVMGEVESGKLSQLFKDGKFKAVYIKEAEEIAEELMEVRQLMGYGVYGSSRFFQALFYMVKKHEIKLVDFLYKLKVSGLRIYPSENKIGYLRQFEDILNKGKVGARIKLL